MSQPPVYTTPLGALGMGPVIQWITQPIFRWAGRTLAKSEPLPGPSVAGGCRQVSLTPPCDQMCHLGGCVRVVVRAMSALGVAAQVQVVAETHVSASIRGCGGWAQPVGQQVQGHLGAGQRWCTTVPAWPPGTRCFWTYVLSWGPASASTMGLVPGMAGHVMAGATGVMGEQVTYSARIRGCHGLSNRKCLESSWRSGAAMQSDDRGGEPDLGTTC